MSSPSAPEKSPILNFLAFVLAFGWEGPVIISIGLRHDSTLEIVMGLIFTVFFWSLFGFKLLRELVKHLFTLVRKLKSAANPATDQPPTKGDS
jgi:hypothetical protein